MLRERKKLSRVLQGISVIDQIGTKSGPTLPSQVLREISVHLVPKPAQNDTEQAINQDSSDEE